MGVLARLQYRLRQFWRTLSSDDLLPEQAAAAAAVLNQGELALFERQALVDRQHSFRVMETLRKSGLQQRDLLAAALLHDVGKIRMKTGRFDRSLVVLAQALIPSLAQKWAAGEAAGWRRPFVVKARHAEWGADLAREAGSSPLTVALIRRHHESKVSKIPVNPSAAEQFDIKTETDGYELDDLLLRLQWADSVN